MLSLDIGDGTYSGLIFLRNEILPAGNDPTGIAEDPEGKCVYVTNSGGTSTSVFNYQLGGSDGSLLLDATNSRDPAGLNPPGSRSYTGFVTRTGGESWRPESDLLQTDADAP